MSDEAYVEHLVSVAFDRWFGGGHAIVAREACAKSPSGPLSQRERVRVRALCAERIEFLQSPKARRALTPTLSQRERESTSLPVRVWSGGIPDKLE